MKVFTGNLTSGSMTITAAMGVKKVSVAAKSGTITIEGNQIFPGEKPATLIPGANTLDSATANNVFNLISETTPIDGLIITCGTGIAQVAIAYS